MKSLTGAPSGARARRQRPRTMPRHQRGIALLVAILLVALGTIIAATVAYENAMTARRGTSTYAFDQSLLIQQGAEALAAYGLRQIRQTDPSHTYPGQGWDKPLGPIEVVPGVMLEASLEDMQGRFNLNNLVQKDGTPDPVYVPAFTQLLQMLGLEPKWTGFLIDWIDADIVPQNPDGAEDSVYMGQTPPYRTANRYITSTSELLALPGFGRDRYLKLAPYVAALAPGHHDQHLHRPRAWCSMHSSAPGTPTSAPTRQRSARTARRPAAASRPLANLPGGVPGRKAGAAPCRRSSARTHMYFRLSSFITIGSAEFNLYSLLYQDTTGAVRPIQRSFTVD